MNFNGCTRFRILLILIPLFLIWQTIKYIPWLQYVNRNSIEQGTESSDNVVPVLVSVFYEALCPDSKNFIVKHLLPTIEKASKIVDVFLIPYGKAKTEEENNGTIKFFCQHGPVECVANKVHACAIKQIPNSTLQVKFISCMISDNTIPEIVGEKCSKQFSVKWEPIEKCVNSEEGSILLKNFGKLTDFMVPKISFVPTVLLNSKKINQSAVLKDLFKEVCSVLNYLPTECASLN